MLSLYIWSSEGFCGYPHRYLKYCGKSRKSIRSVKAFADDKINVAEKLKSVLERVENIVGKGENAGFQHFLLFPQCFQKASFTGSLKVGIMW